ncbi:uncharacterized protein [Cebidichthys violaceus]|uniref:uncharacterized protein isoform X2 n=1 Tax=Cebidichthys violaceus TaxID=271503 RepID=UPI0035CC2C26
MLGKAAVPQDPEQDRAETKETQGTSFNQMARFGEAEHATPSHTSLNKGNPGDRLQPDGKSMKEIWRTDPCNSNYLWKNAAIPSLTRSLQCFPTRPSVMTTRPTYAPVLPCLPFWYLFSRNWKGICWSRWDVFIRLLLPPWISLNSPKNELDAAIPSLTRSLQCFPTRPSVMTTRPTYAPVLPYLPFWYLFSRCCHSQPHQESSVFSHQTQCHDYQTHIRSSTSLPAFLVLVFQDFSTSSGSWPPLSASSM